MRFCVSVSVFSLNSALRCISLPYENLLVGGGQEAAIGRVGDLLVVGVGWSAAGVADEGCQKDPCHSVVREHREPCNTQPTTGKCVEKMTTIIRGR